MTNEESVKLLRELTGSSVYTGPWKPYILSPHLSTEMNNIIASYGVEKLTNDDLEQIIKLAEVLL